MPIFEIQGPDGKTYEVEAPDVNAAVAAVQPGEPPAYGEAPPDMFMNPDTGQMTSRELLRNNYQQDNTRGGAALRGGGQGITLAHGDEVAGLGGLTTGGPERQKFVTERERAKDEGAREDFPWTYGVSEVAGAAIPSVLIARMLGPAAGTKTMGGAMTLGGGTGVVEGFGYGLGIGEGAGKLGSGIKYAGIGAGVGAAAPPLVAGAVGAGRAVGDMVSGGIDTALNRGSQSRATRAVADALAKSGKSADDVSSAITTAAREGQPEYRMMDAMGVPGQRITNSITRAGGAGSDDLQRYLSQRQLDQGDRVASFVEDAFGGPTTAAKTQAALKSARGEAADVAFDAARGNAAPVDIRGAVSAIDDRIGGMKGVDIAGDSIDGKLAGFRKRLIADPAPQGTTSVELSDFNRVLGVKQDVSDAIGAAVRAGRNNEARELTKLRNSLDEALEMASPSYRQANDEFAKASRTIGAVDEGAAMARPGSRASDTTSQFANMTPDQQAAARVGYGDKSLAKIEANAAPTADKSRPFRSTKVSQESQAMATDPRLFGSRIGREGEMWETQNRALGGSRTADNLQDIQSTGALANIARSLKSVGDLKFGQAAANLGPVISPALTGRNEATRKLIAEALMSADPEKVFSKVGGMKAKDAATRRLLEALVRASGRELTP